MSKIRIGHGGRVKIPKSVLEKHNLSPGDAFFVYDSKNERGELEIVLKYFRHETPAKRPDMRSLWKKIKELNITSEKETEYESEGDLYEA